MKEIIEMIKDNDPKGIEELEIFYKKLESTKEFVDKVAKERMKEYTKNEKATDFAVGLAYQNVSQMLNNLIKGE